jgi:hypothetical protein
MITFHRSGIISYLWGMLNELSSLTILSLVSINIPGLPRSIVKSIMSFTQLDIIPSDLILAWFLNFNEVDDHPVNS